MPPQGGMSKVALGPQGPGVQGPNAAMQAIQQMAQNQNQQAMKAMTAMQRVQQEAHDQTSSAVADVANQVAGGMAKLQEERKARKEKVENLQISEDMAQFNQQLQQDASMEAQRVGTMLKNSRDATMTAVGVWNEKRNAMRTNIDAGWAKFNAMREKGVFRDIPDGYKMADQIWKSLKTAEAYHEDNFDPAYLSHATKLLADAERDTVEGRDPMDLAAMYDKPVAQEYAGVKGDKMPDVDGKTRLQLDMRDGYPKEGMLAMRVDDPRRTTAKVVTPDLVAQAVMREAEYSSIVSEEGRDKWMRGQMKNFHEGIGQLSRMAESVESVSDMMFARSPQAIQQGVLKFANDPRASKFSDVGENLGKQMLFEMFPESGAQMVDLAGKIRDRTVTLDTAAEFSAAMALEASAAAIESRANLLIGAANDGSLSKDERGKAQTMMSRLSEQWASSQSPANVARVVGSDGVNKDGTLTAVGLARAQFHVQGQLERTASWAGELRRSAKASGAVSEFQTQFGTKMRLGEILTFKWLDEHGQDRQKAIDLLYNQGEKKIAEQAKTLDLTDLQNVGVEESPELKRSMSIIEATLKFVNEVQPTQLPLAAALLSGGQVDLTDGRVPSFNAATQTESQRDEYMKLVQEALKDHRETRDAAKKSADGGMPWTPEQGLQNKKARESRRQQIADQLKKARGGSTGVMGHFKTGLATIGAGLGVGPLANIAE